MTSEAFDIAGPVRLLNMFQVDETQLEQAEQMIEALCARARADEHCLDLELLRDVTDVTRFVLQLQFASEEELRAYLDADWRRELLKDLPSLLTGEMERVVLTKV